MTDEEARVKKINEMSSDILVDWLKRMEADPDLEGDKLMATIYGSWIAASLLGYSPEAFLDDANRAIKNIKALTDDEETD